MFFLKTRYVASPTPPYGVEIVRLHTNITLSIARGFDVAVGARHTIAVHFDPATDPKALIVARTSVLPRSPRAGSHPPTAVEAPSRG